MILFLKILFVLCVLALLHSYLFYPLLLKVLSKGKKPNTIQFQPGESLPFVSVLLSVYNEEKVITEKIESLLQLDYPFDKLLIYIGSDCSSDETNPIIEGYVQKNKNIRFFPFQERRGKPGVVNELAEMATKEQQRAADHIFLLTDASVMLAKQTLWHLVKHFKNQKIVVVDANMTHTGMKAEGISKSEERYISSEVRIKHRESILWGKMIGPFGGCYAIRSNYFSRIPDNYLVDDFYITMRVFEKGGLAINDLDAICYEPVSHEIREEFRRKARISAGNFQNLLTFRQLWWPPFKALNFAFFSHKVLRWMGPFFLIGLCLSGGILWFFGNQWYGLLFVMIVLSGAIFSILDYFLHQFGINFFPLRSIRYFILMNVALLKGFINFINGITSNVWEPPKRN